MSIEPLESLRVIPEVISAGATTENGLAVFRFFVKGNAPMAVTRDSLDMIGYSKYIYHITEEDAARVRAKLLAEEAEFLKAESAK